LVLAPHLDWLALLNWTFSSGKADPETKEVFASTAEVDEATDLEDGDSAADRHDRRSSRQVKLVNFSGFLTRARICP
jgi:hypothetical protein